MKRIALSLMAGMAMLAAAASADDIQYNGPTTQSVGVVMPDLKDFLHPWDVGTYVMRVTLFASLPKMNGGVAFFGDSLTDVGRWAEAYPNIRVRNFGIFGDTTVGLLHRASQVVDAKPAAVFLMAGTNDVEYGRTPEAIVANLAAIIDQLQAGIPGVKVHVESLLPRGTDYTAKVQEVNVLIKAMAAKRGLVYVDLFPLFEKEGRLDPALTADGIHLMGKGYEVWREAIKDYVAAAAKGE